MKENIVGKGNIFELVQIEQIDGRVFEVARRAPGVRLIIPDRDNGLILLTKEFRRELNNWDYRLPGGKVFDSLYEYETHRQNGNDILDAAIAKAKGEGAEEAGINIVDLELYKKSTLGATVEWDLYVFEVKTWRKNEEGQKLEHGEIIEADNWFTFNEIEQMIIEGKMLEERVALILLQWLKQQ